MTQTHTHIFPPARFPPITNPVGFEYGLDEPKFDPLIHLHLTAPAFVKPLLTSASQSKINGTDPDVMFPVPYGPHGGGGKACAMGPNGQRTPILFPGLAFTAPFRILSDEGVRVCRSIIAREERHAKQNERLPKTLRGLTYRSHFIRDLTYSLDVLQHLSSMAGEPLQPTGVSMNNAQVNFGQIGHDKPVDQWHMDSVPYVLVLLLSDATDMVGGELNVARLADPNEALERIRSDTLDPRTIDTVNYPGPGWAIFMQGSKIAHGVTAVKHAREPRLTLVQSLQPSNPFSDPTHTRYRTFKVQDPGGIAPQEIGRHYAWRVAGKLDYVLERGLWGDEGKEEMLEVLDEAKKELEFATDVMRETIIDESPYKVDESSDAYKEMLKARDEVLTLRSKL